jgi:NADH-quinone oxidoreductase subunit J
MTFVFWVSAVIAIVATLGVVTQVNAIHALLYLIVSLLAVALMFYTLGAPFAAALEVIIYAGAIMVLFVFVVMILNLGPQSTEQERGWLVRQMWIGPAVLTALLIAELIYLLIPRGTPLAGTVVEPRQVGVALFGAYLLGVELASVLLLAGLVGAYHLGRREPAVTRVYDVDVGRAVPAEGRRPATASAVLPSPGGPRPTVERETPGS